MNNFNWEGFFNNWEAEFGFDIFCRDGIVDPTLYFSDAVPYKVLFVLKDVHIPDETKKAIREEKRIVDMREDVFLPGEGKTWNPIALWAKALTESSPIPFENVSSGITLRKETLPRVAFMNIKKEAGNASVSGESVRAYAHEQRLRLLEEIKACSPDIVIACSKDVFAALRDEVLNVQTVTQIDLNPKMGDYGYCLDVSDMLEKESPVYVIEYRHPLDFGRGSLTHKEHYENMLKIRQFVFGD